MNYKIAIKQLFIPHFIIIWAVTGFPLVVASFQPAKHRHKRSFAIRYTLLWRVWQGFNIGELPLQSLPQAPNKRRKINLNQSLTDIFAKFIFRKSSESVNPSDRYLSRYKLLYCTHKKSLFFLLLLKIIRKLRPQMKTKNIYTELMKHRGQQRLKLLSAYHYKPTKPKGKSQKNRQSLLSIEIAKKIKAYILEYHPKEYLFEVASGWKYSAGSLAKVVKQASESASIAKHVTSHALRHSIATHLLEDAVDIRFIQELLGHNSIKTTMRYTHVAKTANMKIVSPLDNT